MIPRNVVVVELLVVNGAAAVFILFLVGVIKSVFNGNWDKFAGISMEALCKY